MKSEFVVRQLLCFGPIIKVFERTWTFRYYIAVMSLIAISGCAKTTVKQGPAVNHPIITPEQYFRAIEFTETWRAAKAKVDLLDSGFLLTVRYTQYKWNEFAYYWRTNSTGEPQLTTIHTDADFFDHLFKTNIKAFYRYLLTNEKPVAWWRERLRFECLTFIPKIDGPDTMIAVRIPWSDKFFD